MADLELFHFDHADPGAAERSAPRKWVGAGGGELETETSFTCAQEGEEEDEEGLSQSSLSELNEEEEVEEEQEEQELEEVEEQEEELEEQELEELEELEEQEEQELKEQEEQEEQELKEQEELEEQEEEEEGISELYLLSDDDLSSDGSGKSADYGFIAAVSCLVTGISLVALSYTVPRDVRVDRDSVSAREMERLEREKARVGAHLDRCVMAGLCLLTLGGVLLSTLLMVSMWKGERMRRKAFAYSQHAAKLYGSISLRAGTSPSCSHGSAAEEDLEALS